MDKKLVLCVAGSGKTSKIVSDLNQEDRALILTYTENNYYNLRKKILDKFGYFPDGIRVETYFKFLYSFCYRPLLHFEIQARGFNWEFPPPFTRYKGKDSELYYLDQERRFYSNRLSLFLNHFGHAQDVVERLEKYFDCLYIDEVQDIGGNDFNFLKCLLTAKLGMKFFGDFYQHTYDTSRDGKVNVSLYKNLKKYVKEFKIFGFEIDETSLHGSYRCSQEVCNFIKNNLKINIGSKRNDSTEVIAIEDVQAIEALMSNDQVVKLFLQKHYTYKCKSLNWGASKGIDHFYDVVVVLNESTYKKLSKADFSGINEETKNKFYVACTRARGTLYFIRENSIPDKFRH